ncbi:hypothetical protein YC2023_115871 [Brassica napus]
MLGSLMMLLRQGVVVRWRCDIVVRRFSWVSRYCFLYCEYPTGVASTNIILHDDEFLKYLKDHQENFRFERM